MNQLCTRWVFGVLLALLPASYSALGGNQIQYFRIGGSNFQPVVPPYDHPVTVTVGPGVPDGPGSVALLHIRGGEIRWGSASFDIQGGQAVNISIAAVTSSIGSTFYYAPITESWEVVGYSGSQGVSASGKVVDVATRTDLPGAEFDAYFASHPVPPAVVEPFNIRVQVGEPSPDSEPAMDFVWNSCTLQQGQVGMPVYTVDPLNAALMVRDTPISVSSAFGPKLEFTLNYREVAPHVARSETQNSNGFSHLGPNWTFNWLSYVVDSPTADSGAQVYLNGGTERYRNFDIYTAQYLPDRNTHSILQKTSPASYQRKMPDGSTRVYGWSNGAASYPRRNKEKGSWFNS